MNTKKEEQLKASLQSVSNAHKEWNQPEKRLAEIEKFADEILAKPDKYENRRGKKSEWLTDEQMLALKIREYARTMRANSCSGIWQPWKPLRSLKVPQTRGKYHVSLSGEKPSGRSCGRRYQSL